MGWEVKGSGTSSGASEGSFCLAANRSGSGMPVVVPNGSAEAEKGSSEVKWALEVCVKKESAAKGSVPLNGSPPNGSDLRKRATDVSLHYMIHYINNNFGSTISLPGHHLKV